MAASVFDFAGVRPSRQSLASGNAVGVGRYIKKLLPNSYDLTKAERDQYLEWGLGVLYNAEQAAGDLVMQGTQYFKDYGHVVADRLQSWDTPTDQGINVALSCDTGVPVGSKEFAQVINNYDAFAAAVKPFGTIGYAQTSVLDLLRIEKISPPGAKHWLPAAYAWSEAKSMAEYMRYPYAGMVQQVGSPIAGTDMNVIFDLAAMGFHWPAGSPYAPKPAPIKGDDMANVTYDVQSGPNGETVGEWLLHQSGIYFHVDPGVGAVSNVTAFEDPNGLAVPTKQGITYQQHLDILAAAQRAPIVNLQPILDAIAQIQVAAGGLTAAQLTAAVSAGVVQAMGGMTVQSTVESTFNKGAS